MKILLVSATPFEIAPLLAYLEKHWNKISFYEFEQNGHTIYPLITGVGSVNTTFALARFSKISEIDFALNVGIAGSFSESLSIGSIVEITKDRFGDLGVEENDGNFTDVFDMELQDKNGFPYANGWIMNEPCLEFDLIKTTGITINKVHGEINSINQIKNKYKAHVESMEGAAFFYACRMLMVKCHQIRTISNYVEPRNKNNWKINEAIDKLNSDLIEMVTNFG